jgi:hypothetical protein
MRKTLRCRNRKCGAYLAVEGPDGRSKEVARSVTCPKCQTKNEVQWPSDTGYTVTVEGVHTAEP